MIDSGTTLLTFAPVIEWQKQALTLIREEFDYSKGSLECLFSGSVGSAKSILLAHLAVTHCLLYPGACCGLFRMSMPDLKDTIFADVLSHLGDDLKENVDYFVDMTRSQVRFRNGSKIISRSFSDKKYTKVRSLRLSMAIFEEATEFVGEHKRAFDEVKQRIRRIPGITENAIILATNPGPPDHWMHDYFILGERTNSNRKVFYSLTFQNPFLDKVYVEQLIDDLDERQVQIMIYGKWLDLQTDVIYYQWDEQHNFKSEQYEIRKDLPIWIGFDWNIGTGKPMSAMAMQYHPETKSYHIFWEWLVEGMRTRQILDEIADTGILEWDNTFYIGGDATGRARDTRSNFSDWEIVDKFFANYLKENDHGLDYELQVPRSNPPQRYRHNLMNGLMMNGDGVVRLFVYEGAKSVAKGFKLVKPLRGSSFKEDDKLREQHVTTAVGYCCCANKRIIEA